MFSHSQSEIATRTVATMNAIRLGSFWDRLVDAREKRHLSTRKIDIGRSLGVGPSAVTKYQEGGLPEFQRIVAEATKCGVSVEWLITGRGPRIPLDDLPPSLRRLIDVCVPFSDAEVEQVLAFAAFRASQKTDELTDSGVRRILE